VALLRNVVGLYNKLAIGDNYEYIEMIIAVGKMSTTNVALIKQ
jgi:hypothetical protein